jgi:hypothetical protein
MNTITELQSHPMIDEDWEEVLSIIPVDLEKSAQETKALQRRREVRTASDLLRLILAYSLCDWSLRLVGMWAFLIKLGRLSDVAVMKRLKKAMPWLKELISAMLAARRLELKAAHPVRVRIVDGSCISEPGSTGIDWRLHLSLDLGSQRFDGIEITDASGGETLARHQSQPGDTWIGDRGYGQRNGAGTILKDGGHIVLRINWSNFPMEEEDGHPFDLFAWLRKTPIADPAEKDVWATTPPGRFPLRLIAQRLPQAAADKARRCIRKQAKKKGRAPNKHTLEAAGYVILVTSLPAAQWTAAQVIALYRLRWQVELVFKRLKSILDLDQLRAKGPELAQAYLLGKLLAALMLDVRTDAATQRHPDLFNQIQRPLSMWRWMTTGRDFLYVAVRWHISWHRFLACLSDLKRYLCISRRKRQNQAVAAKMLLGCVLGPPAIGPPALS